MTAVRADAAMVKEMHMTKVKSSIVVALAAGALVVGMSACKKEGPAERAGREIDKSAEKAGHQIEKAGDKIKDAIKDMKKPN